MKNLIKIVLLSFLIPSLANAQTSKEEFFSDISHASGIYQPYKYTKASFTPAPDGYKPFYLSHYGRHGSRWVHTPESYSNPQQILKEAHQSKMLTKRGEDIYQMINIAAEDALSRYGDLTQLGAEEHKAIAERMYKSFPEIFAQKNGKCNIYSRATIVPRCILSMAANNEKLKELNPEIRMTRDASEKFYYLRNTYSNTKKDSVSVIRDNFVKRHFDVEKFICSVFKDTTYAKKHISNPISFIRSIHLIATDIPDVAYLNFSLLDIFTKEEQFILWQATNMSTYYNCGPSFVNGKVAMDSSKALLRDILTYAENAVNGGKTSADLRFGHDSYIIPLLALMDVKGMNVAESDPEKIYQVWSDFKISPMGVNLQIVFYRNEKTGDVILKLLHCEKEVGIPVKTDIYPYYHWKDFKAYYQEKVR